MVVVASTGIAPDAIADEVVGSEPSVVYRIVTPDTPDVRVMFCDAKYVPAAGLNPGAGRFIVYTATATLLAGIDPAHAVAFSVTD